MKERGEIVKAETAAVSLPVSSRILQTHDTIRGMRQSKGNAIAANQILRRKHEQPILRQAAHAHWCSARNSSHARYMRMHWKGEKLVLQELKTELAAK
jgi:hypothetical protein